MKRVQLIICEDEGDRQQRIAEASRMFEWKKKRSRQVAKNTSTQRFVMRRAGSACEVCRFSFRSILNVHHILPVSLGGSARVQNLIILCPNCHGMVHHYRKPEYVSQLVDWSRGIQSAGYTEQAAHRILLIASQEAIVNHDGSIHPHEHPSPQCFVLKSELCKNYVGESTT